MKIVKMLLAMICAGMLCACADNPLDYVEENADWVIYGNLEQILDFKLTKVLESKMKDNPEFNGFKEQFKAMFGVKYSECAGKLAVWGKMDGTNIKAVIVLEDLEAEDILDSLIKNMKAQGRDVEKCDIDDFPAAIVKNGGQVVFTVAATDTHTLQFFFQDDPSSVLEPAKEDSIANEIDTDATLALVLAGDAMRKAIKEGTGSSAPDIGNACIMIYADNDQLEIRGSLDISELDED